MKYQRKLQNIPCSECGKIGVYLRGLCQACYSKMRRNTPEGKEKQKIYNATKGKEAQKRYLDKQPQKPPKEKKEKKENTLCECGKTTVTKGLCMKCYQKYYQRRKQNFKARERKEKKEMRMKKLFESVLYEVKSGLTIQNACQKIKIDRLMFYKNISDQQKTLLRSTKAIYFNKHKTIVYDECELDR